MFDTINITNITFLIFRIILLFTIFSSYYSQYNNELFEQPKSIIKTNNSYSFSQLFKFTQPIKPIIMNVNKFIYISNLK